MTSNELDHDSRLNQVIADYLRAVEAGSEPDPRDLYAQYPDMAEELKVFHDNYMWMGRAEPAHHDPDEGDFPRSFGEYELLGVIGRGGMGVVYRARHLRQGRTVALKMIGTGRLVTAEAVARFRREVNTLKSLEHPNLVPVYDVGEHEGQHYFTMRIIEGGSLDEHLAYYGERPREAAKLIIAIGRGVRYAHQRAIIHRDLKPGNVLLDEERQPHVVDFGLALEMGRDTRMTATGEILGTLPYMAPEQTEGETGLSLRVDVYSLGAILYELLTGQPPIKGPAVIETLRRVREEEPRNPRLLNPAVDRDLATICLGCLEKNPSKRYENVGQLTDDLERWLEGRPISRRPVGRAERLLRWSRRKPGATALVAVSAVLFLVGGIAVEREARLRTERKAFAEGRRQERLETNMSFARQIAGRIQQRLTKWGRMVENNATRPELIAGLDVWNRKVRDVPNYKGEDYRQKVEDLVLEPEGRRLQEILEAIPPDLDIENWQLMDEQGMMIGRTPRNGRNPDGSPMERRYWRRDYFARARDHEQQKVKSSVHVSTAYFSMIDECFKIDVSSPVFGPDGKVLGILAISATTSRDWNLPDFGDERRKAVLIARSDPSQPQHHKVKEFPPYVIILHPLLKPREDTPGFTKNPFPIPYERDCGAELLVGERARTRASKADDYMDPFRKEHADYDGPWLAAFAPVGQTGMVALVQQREE